jgi:hypothetical protein
MPNKVDYTLRAGIEQNCPFTVELAISLGANLNAQFPDEIENTNCSQPLLHRAAKAENIKILELLLQTNTNPNTQDQDNQQTALHICATQWHSKPIQKIKTLINFKANPNIQDLNGKTPLHLAAAHDNCETCQTLINCGANPNIFDNHGKLPTELTHHVKTTIAINPELVVSIVCRQCHLQCKALWKCQRKNLIKRFHIRSIPKDCPFHLELQLHQGEKNPQRKRKTR